MAWFGKAQQLSLRRRRIFHPCLEFAIHLLLRPTNNAEPGAVGRRIGYKLTNPCTFVLKGGTTMKRSGAVGEYAPRATMRRRGMKAFLEKRKPSDTGS